MWSTLPGGQASVPRCERQYTTWEPGKWPAMYPMWRAGQTWKEPVPGLPFLRGGTRAKAASGGVGVANAKTPKKKPPKKAVTRVGLISGGVDLTPSQRLALDETLAFIASKHPGRLFLHHGCRAGADETAHNKARALGGWRIHGHPSHEEDGRATPWGKGIRPGMIGAPDVVHYSRLRSDRDADILKGIRCHTGRSSPPCVRSGICADGNPSNAYRRAKGWTQGSLYTRDERLRRTLRGGCPCAADGQYGCAIRNCEEGRIGSSQVSCLKAGPLACPERLRNTG